VLAAWITDAVCRSFVIPARRCLALLKFTAALIEPANGLASSRAVDTIVSGGYRHAHRGLVAAAGW
jgi:hypothetical protein